jgi:hypothetical protein
MVRLISSAELFRKTERELTALFYAATIVLAKTDEETPDRRNALGNLENIERARAYRMAHG